MVKNLSQELKEILDIVIFADYSTAIDKDKISIAMHRLNNMISFLDFEAPQIIDAAWNKAYNDQ